MRSFIIVFIYMIKAEPLLDLYFSTWRLERVSEKGKIHEKYLAFKLEMTISSTYSQLIQSKLTQSLLNTGNLDISSWAMIGPEGKYQLMF